MDNQNVIIEEISILEITLDDWDNHIGDLVIF